MVFTRNSVKGAPDVKWPLSHDVYSKKFIDEVKGVLGQHFVTKALEAWKEEPSKTRVKTEFMGPLAKAMAVGREKAKEAGVNAAQQYAKDYAKAKVKSYVMDKVKSAVKTTAKVALAVGAAGLLYKGGEALYQGQNLSNMLPDNLWETLKDNRFTSNFGAYYEAATDNSVTQGIHSAAKTAYEATEGYLPRAVSFPLKHIGKTAIHPIATTSSVANFATDNAVTNNVVWAGKGLGSIGYGMVDNGVTRWSAGLGLKAVQSLGSLGYSAIDNSYTRSLASGVFNLVVPPKIADLFNGGTTP